MEELVKSPEGREDEKKSLPDDVVGVLSVHIKTLAMNDTEIDSSSMTQLLQLRLEVCSCPKIFPLSSMTESGQIICDKARHFSIELSDESDDPGNNLSIELLTSSPLLPGMSSVLGKAVLNLHTIIHDSPVSGSCDLKDENGVVFAVINAEFVFVYGSFGYAGSSLIQYSDRKPADYIHFSAFPRLHPQEGRTDTNGLVLLPQATKHPTFIPFNQHASLLSQLALYSSNHQTGNRVWRPYLSEDQPCCARSSMKESLSSLEAPAELSPQILMSRMSRLHSLHQKMKCLSERKERLKFLKDVVLHRDSQERVDLNVGITARKRGGLVISQK